MTTSPITPSPHHPITHAFTTIRTEGGLLAPDLLARVAASEGLSGLEPEAYGLPRGERLNEAIARAWDHARAYWTAWQASLEGGAGVSEMREQWLLPLFRELGYGRLTYRQAAEEVAGRRFVISHRAGEGEQAPPVHTIAPAANGDGARSWLDQAARADGAGPRRSPHGHMQEYLNRTGHLWGIVTDGRTLRLLRDNASLSRAAYVEVDLEAMFREGVYSDFVLLYLLLHRSRLPRDGQPVEEAWLEIWRREGEASGARALDDLRGGVETALLALGQGFLEHPANGELRRRLQRGELDVQGYYRQLLRLVYRLLFLLAAESRDLLFAPEAEAKQKQIYREHYGIGRLRDLARRRSTDRHDDLWQGVQVLFRALRDEEMAAVLGVAPLGGLFDPREMPDIDGLESRAPLPDDPHPLTPSPSAEGEGELLPAAAFRGERRPGETAPLSPRTGRGAGGEGVSGAGNNAPKLANHHLLAALRGLGWVQTGHALTRINYRDMDVEELGSVYEGLLEQQPRLETAGERTTFTLGRSGERKTTGSYYTNPGLVRELIRSALDPAIAAALARGSTNDEKRRHLLDLKVCDPACGSGHFLLAAARRIGRALAEAEAGDDEPAPAQERAAVREAIGHCLHGVDLNPLAVDLCKVALWLEGQHAGKPLQFLDHHIRHGNALIGATAAAMAEGIPDAAFDPVTGDSKAYATTIKKRNRAERKGQLAFEQFGVQITHVSDPDSLRRFFRSLEADDDSLAGVARKADLFARHQASPAFQQRILTADCWVAAFFWPLQSGEANPPTQAVWRRLAANPGLAALATAPKEQPDARTVQQARALAQRHDVFHWELEFEEVFSRPDPGFDVILGNPPWERIKLQEQEFFAQREPDIAAAPNAAARKRLIAALPQTNPRLSDAYEEAKRASEAESKFLRGSGRYPLTGRGDINTYSVFSESNTAHLRRTGRAGMLVPTGIATDDTNKAFFSSLVDNRRLVSLYDFENSQGLFPNVHRSYKFSLLTTGQPLHPDGAFDVAFFLTQPAQLDDPARVFTLSPQEIALLNPNTRTAPIFRSARDAAITTRLYRAAPVLVREGEEEFNPWGVTFKRMFDMSNDSHLFRTREDLEASGHTLGADGRFRGPDGQDAWERLYEAKMIHQYDHRFATYAHAQDSRNADKARDTTLAEHEDPDFVVLGRYWINETDVERAANRGSGLLNQWFLGFRDIARATDERTGIFSLIPWAGVNHKTPLLIPNCDSSKLAAFLANCNSLAFDFVARQKVGGTSLGFFIVKQLPVLPPETYTPALLDLIVPRVLELVYTAWDLAPFARDLGYDGDPCPWDEQRRALLRAELDGLYAHLYGLSREDFAYILDQFPIVRRKDEAAYGEYRTARMCLQAYDYFARPARETLRTAVEEIELHLRQLLVRRLDDDLSRVPAQVQEQVAAERLKQGKPPRASSLSDLLGSGYLPLLGKVIRANREQHFADLFASNGQVEAHLSPVIGLRNELAHPKGPFISDGVRRSGEREVRWFAEKLGVDVALVTGVMGDG